MLVCKINDLNHRIEKKTGLPLKDLSVELTRQCNFSCKHCFLINPVSGTTRKPELPYDKWVEIFEQYAAENGLFITLTGGEPLLRNDFKELWVYLKKRGFLITLFTNGSLIDQEMAEFFAKWTPLEVSITLYGASEETYHKATGRKNSFGKVVNALSLLKEKGIPLEVKGVFSKLNVEDFMQIREISLNYCDLFRWDMALMGAYPYSGNKPMDIRLTPEEYAEIELQDPVRRTEMQTIFKKWDPSSFIGSKERAFTCNVANGSSVHIDAYGSMHPCLPLESEGYDVVNGTLSEGWNSAIPDLVKNYPFDPGACQTCEAAEVCGPCVAFAELEGCSPTGPVPYKCRLVKARAAHFNAHDKLQRVFENNCLTVKN